jgi:hypothetical protein
VRASKDGDDGVSGGRRPVFVGCDVVRDSVDETCGGVGGGVRGPEDCGDGPGE